MMLKDLRPSLALLLILTLVTGFAYPLLLTVAGHALFPYQANGSLIERNGRVIGSALIGQSFADPAYVWGRPSATTMPDPADESKTVAAPYNAANSGASNLAPSAKAFIDAVNQQSDRLKASDPDQTTPPPADLVMASASGLDPDISPQAAMWQARRVAMARHASLADVQALIETLTEPRTLGILGEPHVNVLALNMALDARWPKP